MGQRHPQRSGTRSAADVPGIARDLIAAAIRGDRDLGTAAAARAARPDVAGEVTQLLDDVVSAALLEWAGGSALPPAEVDEFTARMTFLSSTGRWYPGIAPSSAIYRRRLEAHNAGVKDLAAVTSLPPGITDAGALSVMAAAVLMDERGSGFWQYSDDWEDRLDHVEAELSR